MLGRVALHRRDRAGAEAALVPAEAQLARSGPVLGAELVLWARAVADEQAGREPSLDLLALAWELHPLRHLLSWRAIAPDLVRWAVAGGRVDLAAGVVSTAEEVAARSGIAGIAATAARCRALLTGEPGDALAALDHARRGARLIDLGPALAEAAPAGRDRSCTAALLREAAALYGRMGAGADVARVADLARRQGVRLDAPAARRAGAPSDALTGAERSVAALAASGLTNREIGSRLAMSRHTVDTHLRRVYAKLAITGRVELARRWRDDAPR